MLTKALKLALIILLAIAFWKIRHDVGIKSMEDAHIWLHSISNPHQVVALYVLLTVAAGVLCLPISWFKACGAIYFGFTYGFVYGYLIAVVSAVLSFVIGRFLGRDFVDALYHKWFKALLSEKRRQWLETRGDVTFFHVFVLRNLYFVPFFMTNYALSVSKVRFKTYFWATALGMIPGTGIFTYFISHSLDYLSDPSTLLVPVMLAALYYIGLYLMTRKHKKTLWSH